MGSISGSFEVFEVYGISLSDFDEARKLVERSLGIHLVPHESMYFGGDYYRLDRGDGGNIIVRCNFNNFENDWEEEDYKYCPFLLFINYLRRCEEYEELLLRRSDFVFIRREKL